MGPQGAFRDSAPQRSKARWAALRDFRGPVLITSGHRMSGVETHAKKHLACCRVALDFLCFE
eukprot:7583568-Pyramimonas_sp.AAC.1